MNHSDLALQFSVNKDKVFHELIQDIIYTISVSNDTNTSINNQILTDRISKALKDLEEIVNEYKNWNSFDLEIK